MPAPPNHRRSLLHIGLLCCLIPCIAQAESKPERSCRILFFEAPESAPRKLFLHDGTSSQEVDLPRMNFSEVYQIAPGNIRVHLLPTLLPTGEAIDARAPSAAIPEEVRDCYLLLTSDPKNTVAPIQIQWINANPDKFRAGQMLWINLTQSTVSGRIGSRNLKMGPRSRAIVDAPARSGTDYPVRIDYILPDDSIVRPICETRWRHTPGARGLVFVFNQNGRAIPRVMGFPDYRNPPPPSAH